MFLADNQHLKLITDLFDEKVGYPLPELEAKVVRVSHDHFDHNNAALVRGVRHVISDFESFFMGPVKIEGCSSYHAASQGKKSNEDLI